MIVNSLMELHRSLMPGCQIQCFWYYPILPKQKNE